MAILLKKNCVCGFQCCSQLQIDTDRCPGTLAVFPVHAELAVIVSPICPRLHQVFDVSAVGNQVRQVIARFLCLPSEEVIPGCAPFRLDQGPLISWGRL